MNPGFSGKPARRTASRTRDLVLACVYWCNMNINEAENLSLHFAHANFLNFLCVKAQVLAEGTIFL